MESEGGGWMDGSELNSCQHLSSVNVLSRVCQSAFPHNSMPTLEVCDILRMCVLKQNVGSGGNVK